MGRHVPLRNPGTPRPVRVQDRTFVGPWGDHFEAMGDKTAFLQLVRWLPKSTELAGAISDDPESTGLIDTVATTVADDVIDVDEAS